MKTIPFSDKILAVFLSSVHSVSYVILTASSNVYRYEKFYIDYAPKRVLGIFITGRNTYGCIFVKVYEPLPIIQPYKELLAKIHPIL